ncbi:FMN-binding protein [Desulfosarcina sp. OttesenSCG-928-B08]|nr:FMN-binding protein [Desulfosarcina sp. OttesenSCG-928-B08]
MSEKLKSLGFAMLVALVCGLLLISAASGLNARKQRNMAVDQKKNILSSVGLVTPDQRLPADRIEALYDENIRCYAMDGAGRIVPANTADTALPVCFRVKEKKPAAYILPVDSKGLWGRIYGYIAIENDGKTVAGFSVYSHNETPGLGGEIEKPWFQEHFRGKKIVDASGSLVSVGIAKGRVADAVSKDRQDTYVDGISGATLTGSFLSAGLKGILTEYEPLSAQFRKGPVALPETP